MVTRIFTEPGVAQQEHMILRRSRKSSPRLSDHRLDPLRMANQAIQRRRNQLPSFAPLLEELEISGWSSHRDELAGNFHDWLPLEDGSVLVALGKAVESATGDPIDAALVAQSIWTAIRSHALHTDNAGTIASLVSKTWGSGSIGGAAASVAIAIVAPTGGRIHVAVAGHCLAIRVRAATCETLHTHGFPVGTQPATHYPCQQFELRPRERFVLFTAINASASMAIENSIGQHFSNVSAESHRKMTATETLKHLRSVVEDLDDATSTSGLVIRRR
jgi:serine phosphatase RsbU (regulator of sigma subunit)